MSRNKNNKVIPITPPALAPTQEPPAPTGPKKLPLKPQESEVLRGLIATREGASFAVRRYLDHVLTVRHLDSKKWGISQDLSTLEELPPPPEPATPPAPPVPVHEV